MAKKVKRELMWGLWAESVGYLSVFVATREEARAMQRVHTSYRVIRVRITEVK